MSLNTHSRFYFGHVVDEDNNLIDLDDGMGPVIATLNPGEYSLTEYAVELARALTEAATQDYTVVIDRLTRKLTISAPLPFDLLISSGASVGTSAFPMAGFSGADLTGLASYQGNLGSGEEYTTQFILQNYVPEDAFQKPVEATVNESASGKVEVFKFGDKNFIEVDFKFITSRTLGSPLIRDRVTGREDFLNFQRYMVTKGPFEFMPDEDDPSDFLKVILESTPEDSKGTGFKLKELYDKGLPDIFDSGALRMRVQS